MKKLSVLLLALVLIPGSVFAEGSGAGLHCFLKGKALEAGGPFIQDNRTFASAELLKKEGFDITVDGKAIAVKDKDRSITMTVGEKEYRADAAKFTMDVAPFEKDGEVYLPLRYVSEGFGMKVTWDEDKRVACLGDYTEELPFGGEEHTTKDGFSFVIPEKYKNYYEIEDDRSEVRFYDKANYRKTDHVGLIGTMVKVADPTEAKEPMLLLSPVPGGYLIFTYAEVTGMKNVEDENLKEQYEQSKTALAEVLKTVMTKDHIE